MEFNAVADDSLIWKRKGLVSPEITDVENKIRGIFDPGVTYEITLERPYKSLKVYLRGEFKDDKTLNIKPKDSEGKSWYIRIDPRPQAKRSPKPAKKKSASAAQDPVPASS